MNKARRHELKMLHYKKRLKNLGLYKPNEFNVPKKEAIETCAIKANYNSYRTSGKPCSCLSCSPLKYKRNIKHKLRVIEEAYPLSLIN